jgi:hypothetical protein
MFESIYQICPSSRLPLLDSKVVNVPFRKVTPSSSRRRFREVGGVLLGMWPWVKKTPTGWQCVLMDGMLYLAGLASLPKILGRLVARSVVRVGDSEYGLLIDGHPGLCMCTRTIQMLINPGSRQVSLF